MNTHWSLASASFVSAPGILKWAMNGWRFKKDRPKILNVMRSWEGPTDDEWANLLSGKTTYEVDASENVIFPKAVPTMA